MQSTLKLPFTNLQQELLQLYARQISEDDLANVKELIGKYFAQRLSHLADNAWEKNNWGHHDIEDMLNDPAQ